MAQQQNLFAAEQQFILGQVITSIFHNEQNMYSIVNVKIKETNCNYQEKEIIVVGYFPKLVEEDWYRFEGVLKQHPKYGMQFQTTTFTKEMPATEQGVIHYLSSDLFTGIGRKTAENIVKTLGENVIHRILENPSVLDEVPRLSEDKKEVITTVLQDNLGLERVMIQLNDWGFGPQVAMKIYQEYREETLPLLQENPYRLIEDVEGVGFIRADELGANLGITGKHPDRVKAAIIHTITQASLSEGHVYVDADFLLPRVKGLLEKSQREIIAFDDISQAALALVDEERLAAEEMRFYLPSLYVSEVGIASKILTLLERNEQDNQPFSKDEIRLAIGAVEESLGVSYAETQALAIETAILSSTMILTGGPGTGKTTVIRGLVEVFAELHGLSLSAKYYADKEQAFPIVLAAPTGRAAKRLAESTELPAMTIHRLLGFNGQEKGEETERELDGKLLIIDEMSMVDTWLAHQLLKAVPSTMQVIFVGDQDQLPPVGPGQVLKDLLASQQLPIVELTDIYRQAADSTIIQLAHSIKKGVVPDNLTQKSADRSFIKASSYQVSHVVTQIVQSALAKGQQIRDVQVLAPMYRGPAGIDRLNKDIQALVNPNPDGTRKEIAFGDTSYRIKDKVLQLVNQPENNVFNGDMGEVISIIKAKETIEKQDLLVVSFDGIEVTYQRGDLNQLTLAYCCSIHKAQGSEFQTVIMPVVNGYSKMLRRNLLYTGITRARDFLILCGEPDVLANGLMRTDDLQRRTSLTARLTLIGNIDAEVAEGEETSEVPQHLTVETAPKIAPMIGMENVSPYDFL